MKIIKLTASNIKKLKQVDIEPDQNLVLVTGKNRNGKTSLLDCILYALGGKSAIPDKPIRDGEKFGFVDLDLGDYKVHRKFTENGTYLEVKNKEGLSFNKKQSILNNMINSLYFDPLEFMNKQAKEQKEIVLKALGVDLSKERKEYQEVYDDRKLIGRERRKLKAQLDSMEKPSDKNMYGKKVSVSGLVQQHNKVKEQIDSIVQDQRDIKNYKDDIGSLNREIEELKSKIKSKQKLASDYKENIEHLKEKNKGVDKDKLLKQSKEIEDKINNAEETNNKIEKAHKFVNIEKEHKDKKEEYENKTVKLEKIVNQKSVKLSNANLPEALDVSQEGLTYDEVPLEQISGAEKLMVSLEIAMMLSGELQVIRITDGSLLDADSLKTVKQMAEEKDFQVWLEYVKNEDDGIGIYLENGEVKSKKDEN